VVVMAAALEVLVAVRAAEQVEAEVIVMLHSSSRLTLARLPSLLDMLFGLASCFEMMKDMWVHL